MFNPMALYKNDYYPKPMNYPFHIMIYLIDEWYLKLFIDMNNPVLYSIEGRGLKSKISHIIILGSDEEENILSISIFYKKIHII